VRIFVAQVYSISLFYASDSYTNRSNSSW